jgi:hypothetical protein
VPSGTRVSMPKTPCSATASLCVQMQQADFCCTLATSCANDLLLMTHVDGFGARWVIRQAERLRRRRSPSGTFITHACDAIVVSLASTNAVSTK